MDITKWKKVLLQWITECGFMERIYYNIEQTDLDAFFRNYCRHVHSKGTTIPLTSAKLSCFLQEQYPEYQAHFERASVLSTSDYVYVYSLLLHFSCVKNPEEYFHKICQRLPESSQQKIADFFKFLLECPDFTREAIHYAIAEITQSCPESTNDSFTMGSGEMQSATQTDLSIRTPKRPSIQNVSPPTPKTCLLEERTRELYSLRASLETERYEKGLLEVQIKQYEEKIQKLNQDHRKLQMQIQELKNDILTRNTENSTSPKQDSDEQVKVRLCREISQKEQDVSKLRDILSTLKEEKCLLQEQLNYAKKQVVVCMNRIEELDYKVDELKAEIEKKDGTIQYLTNNKLELEHFIAETLADTKSARSDLNTSIDCLEGSFSRESNSSGSQKSPENLARSVIDVQLREKEKENQELRETLNNIRNSNNRLGRQMKIITQQHAEVWKINIENIIENDNEFVDPAKNLLMLSSCVDEMTKRWKNEQNTMKKLEQDTLAVQKENAKLYQRVQEFESDMAEKEAYIQRAEKISHDLAIEKQELSERLSSCEQEFERLQQKRINLVAKFDCLSTEYEALKSSSQATQNELNSKLADIQSELVCKAKRIESLEAHEKHLEKVNYELQEKLNILSDKFQSKTTEYDLEVKSLNARLISREQELKSRYAAEVSVKEKYEKLLISCEDMKQKARDADQHLETMRNEIAIKEIEMKKLGAEIIEVHKKNSELEERIDSIMLQRKQDLQYSDTAINKKEELLKSITCEKGKLQQQLDEAEKINKQNQDHTVKISKDLQEISSKVKELLALFKSFSREKGDEIEKIESTPAPALDKIIERVKLLLDQRKRDTAEMESLQLEKIQLKEELYEAQQTLQNGFQQKEELIDQQSLTINECKAQIILAEERIHGYENQLETLQQQQANFIQNIEEQLQLHLTDRASNLTQLQQLEKERHAENEDYARLERELVLVIAEHNSVKLKLIETENENTQLREERHKMLLDHSEKVNMFLIKLKQFEQENSQLLTEINNFKQQHSRAEALLEKANVELEELSGKLSEETLSKNQLDLKLRHNEIRMLESEKKLRSILEENSSSLQKLQSTYEDKALDLKNALEKMKELEQIKSAQDAQLEENNLELEKLFNEKRRFHERYTDVCDQLEREQSEKATLLQSLEKTADQLKIAIDEKEQDTAVLEQRCCDLQTQYNVAVELKERLQSEMASKETEWTLQFDEIESEHAEMQSKLMRTISNQTEQLEANELALTEIITIMENIQHSPGKLLIESIVFNTPETNNDQIPQHNQLKIVLNKFLQKTMQLQQEANEAERKCKEAIDYGETLTEANKKLSAQVTRSKAEIADLQERLMKEMGATESKLNNEIQRLKEDIQNAEDVNEKLSVENANLQYKQTNLEEKMANAKLKIAILTEELKELKQCRDCKQVPQFEHEMQEKSNRICVLEEDLRKTNEFVNKLKKQINKLELQASSHLNETRELSEKARLLQEENDNLESDLNKKNQENTTLRKENEEAIAGRCMSEKKCSEIISQIEQLKKVLKSMEDNLETSQNENRRLMDSVEVLRSEKADLCDALKEHKRELQRSMDNVTELIQQIASIRLEKEAVLEENQELRKQYEESSKGHSVTEAKIKSIIDRSQTLELSLKSAENDLKFIRTNWKNCEQNVEKLSSDNKRMNETNEALTKRIEKLALKLGDSQAKTAKLNHENEKLTKTIEANNNLLEAMRREKEAAHTENKSMKERLSRMERNQDQLMSKVQALERANATVEEAKARLEAAEFDVKSKLVKLEKTRESNEEKIRKLNHSLNISEKSNVCLNLEIGALNSQLGELRRSVSEERSGQIEELQNKLLKAEKQAKSLEARCGELEQEAERLRSENTQITEKYSKVYLSLQTTKEQYDLLDNEMQQLRNDIEELRAAKQRLDTEHKASVALLKQQVIHKNSLLAEKQALVTELEEKLAEVRTQLGEKTALLDNVEEDVKHLRESLAEKETKEETVAKYVTDIMTMRTDLSETKELLEKEQSITSQLRTDNQHLQTKYTETKIRFAEEIRQREERIKENRLELEGKLEKMKNKMKSLYTEEISKMKAKQEREIAVIKSELDVLRSQNAKYEEHTRKLSNQIMMLNENILEYKKQNAVMGANIKHLESDNRFKKPTSAHVSSSSNLVMEDEEGEVFNNTYLADLKNGRMSEFIERNICPEELQYRNSLLPPHLQSTYAAQYDHGLTEDELKDGQNSLDDSLSALLSATTAGGGIRKKICGATSYKRPGPPTPSKNGGRLSLGGSSEQAREILKESFDNNGEVAISSSKTPARFKIFSSRFSIGSGNIKDEIPLDLRKTAHKQNFKLFRLAAAGAICTSTPRKSKSHFDQRRLLDQMELTSPMLPSAFCQSKTDSGTLELKLSFAENNLEKSNENKLIADVASSVNDNGNNDRLFKALNVDTLEVKGSWVEEQGKTLCVRNRCNVMSKSNRRCSRFRPKCLKPEDGTAETNSSQPIVHVCSSATTSSECQSSSLRQRRMRRSLRHRCRARPSLSLRSDIFSKHRTPARNCAGFYRDLIRKRARRQRTDNFNKFRMLKTAKLSNDGVICSEIMKIRSQNFSENNDLLKGGGQKESSRDESDESDSLLEETENITFVQDDNKFLDENKIIELNSLEDDKSCDCNIIPYVGAKNLNRYLQFDKCFDVRLLDYDRSKALANSKYFEKLLAETESEAPFGIRKLQFKSSAVTSLAAATTTQVTSTSSSLALCAQNSSSISSSYNSRTIYGGSVIYNRKIPNINRTYVRKSSIYIKQKGCDEDVILLTNQTINLMDLARMWAQMNFTARVVLCFLLLASTTAIIIAFVKFFSKIQEG